MLLQSLAVLSYHPSPDHCIDGNVQAYYYSCRKDMHTMGSEYGSIVVLIEIVFEIMPFISELSLYF